MSIKIIPSEYGHSQQIEFLNLHDIELLLKTKVNEFLWNEILAIYQDSGMSRKYKQANLSSWAGFSHFKAMAGYSVWKYNVSDMAFNILNLLYMDGERLLENRGEAQSEDLGLFDRVLLCSEFATPIYEDYTEEAGSEQGTPFGLMDSGEDFLYIGSSQEFNSLTLMFSVFGSGYAIKAEYWAETATPGWQDLTINDDTEDMSSDGRISFDIPEDWGQCEVDGHEHYWIRISSVTIPTIIAQAYSILPGTSVATLLALSRTQLQNKEWAWCYFNNYVYMTIKNEGGGYYEGTDFIKDSSSDINKENFFEANHHYKAIYQDENYSPSAWAPEHIVVSKGTSFPESPTIGQLFYRTDQDKWYIYKGYTTPIWEEIESAGMGGDMFKSIYDTDNDGIVDNSEKLEGKTLAEVQDHTPKTHTLDSHSEKKLDTLDEKTPNAGVTIDSCLIKDGKVADSNLLEGSTKAQVQDHSAKAHNLGGAEHVADTLANLNAKISDANLDNERTLAFFIPTADITVGTNKTYEIYVPFIAGLTILKVYITAKVAPGNGKIVTLDVNKNGTTIFTTQGGRPTITGTEVSGESDTPDVTALARNDILSVDVDVATAGHSATDMTIQVRCKVA